MLHQSDSMGDDNVQDHLNVSLADSESGRSLLSSSICCSSSKSDDNGEDEYMGHDATNEHSDEDCDVPENSGQALDSSSILAVL